MSLEEKYANKILGIRNYKHEQSEFFVKDFIDLDLFEPILDEFIVSESDITPAGKAFLEEYYVDLKKLSQLLHARGNIKEIYPHYDKSSVEEIYEAIKDLQPMQAITFIEKARGNITGDEDLNENLLPPS